MTRLFLRFYLGVIFLLFAAWVIQAFVFRRTTVDENIAVIEAVLSGGARLARDRIVAGGEVDLANSMAYLTEQFEYPVRLVERSQRQLNPEQARRLDGGDAILFGGGIEIAIPESEYLVEMGPLPTFAAPTQSDISLGLGAVFLLSAIGIAFLLRPVAIQLRNVERTALAIAAGDLTARIGTAGRRRALPIGNAFDAMADRVEKLLKSQKELMQAVSHELRTPLSRIKFATALMETAGDSEKRATRIASIDLATEQLDELIGELLAYVKLDAGAEAGQTAPVSVREVVENAINSHQMLYPTISFQVDLPTDEPHVNGYRIGLLRAVGNLVGNAAKFARSKVQVSVEVNQDQLQINVDDDGCGVAPEHRESIFEPFNRISGDSPGAGLGLAIVKRIALRAGGHVEVNESRLGGAQFRFIQPTDPKQ